MKKHFTYFEIQLYTNLLLSKHVTKYINFMFAKTLEKN